MKTLIVAMALVLAVSLGLSQGPPVSSQVFYVYASAKNTTDTIPGHQNGASGAGYAGWLYVGNDDVYISYFALDSMETLVYVDYADSGVTSSANASAAAIAFNTVAVAAGDTLLSMDGTNDYDIVTRTLRDDITNSILGARWLRFRCFHPNNDNFAAAAAGRTMRLRVTRIKR